MKKVAILLPCFNESSLLKAFNSDLLKAIVKLKYKFEIVYINDGSTDDSSTLIQTLKSEASNINVTLLNLQFNLGHQGSITQGLLFSENRCYDNILIMDADGEDDPAAIEEILQHSDQDLVQVVRGKRKESFRFKILYTFYKYLFLLLIGKRINFGNFSLIKPKLATAALEKSFDNLAAFLDNQRCTKVQIKWDRKKRLDGHSKMNFKGLFYHAMNSLTENAQSLLFQFIRLGLVIVIGILFVTGVVFYKKFYLEVAVLGWTSSLLTTLFNSFLICAGVFILGIMQLSILQKKSSTKARALYDEVTISTNWSD